MRSNRCREGEELLFTVECREAKPLFGDKMHLYFKGLYRREIAREV